MKVYLHASFQVDHKPPCFFCTDVYTSSLSVFTLVDKSILFLKTVYRLFHFFFLLFKSLFGIYVSSLIYEVYFDLNF
jgi:hypothetical protein